NVGSSIFKHFQLGLNKLPVTTVNHIIRITQPFQQSVFASGRRFMTGIYSKRGYYSSCNRAQLKVGPSHLKRMTNKEYILFVLRINGSFIVTPKGINEIVPVLIPDSITFIRITRPTRREVNLKVGTGYFVFPANVKFGVLHLIAKLIQNFAKGAHSLVWQSIIHIE